MLGKLKLGIGSDQTDLKFDEADGTEYDDDERLALFDNQRILVIGRNWTPSVACLDPSPIADIPVSLPVTSPVFSSTLASDAMPLGKFESVEACSSEMSKFWTESWPTDSELEFMTSTPRSASLHEGKSFIVFKMETEKHMIKKYWYFLIYTNICSYVS